MRILLIGNQHPTSDSGISAYLGKPVCPTHLLTALWQLNHNYSQLQKYIPKPEKETVMSNATHEILLAEDNEINQAFVGQALKNKGYQVTIASTGPEVLDWLNQKKFDLILMDLELPELDGFEVTKQIRQNELSQKGLENDQHIPILALTAHSDEQILARAIQSGIDDYLLKPFKISSLQKKLSEYLSIPLVEELNPSAPSSTAKEPLRQSAIDQINITEQTDEKIEQLKHLVILFEQSTSKQLSRIYEAIEDESIDALQQNIHALKGGISIFTTGNAYQVAKSFEDSTLSPHKKEYATLKRKADELKIAVNTLREDLQTMIEMR
jgi:CheY-like chemotaxis protein/HPt (histidine-containing phosphotransfer) domain-containing protein